MSSAAAMLDGVRTIAVVGLSSDPRRPSYGVSRYMQDAGYRIIPVNPAETSVLGEPAYASLADVPEPIDLVDVFRRPEAVPAIVEEMIALGLKRLWLQQGITHPEAEARAAAAGIAVISDRCVLQEHARLGL